MGSLSLRVGISLTSDLEHDLSVHEVSGTTGVRQPPTYDRSTVRVAVLRGQFTPLAAQPSHSWSHLFNALWSRPWSIAGTTLITPRPRSFRVLGVLT